MKKILLLLFVLSSTMFSQELIVNNASFKKGLTSWQFGVASYDEDIPDAEFFVVNGGHDDESACKIKMKISTSSTNFNDAYLMYRNLNVKKGKIYRVRFYVKSNKKKDKIGVTLGSGTPPDLQVLQDREVSFDGDNSWKSISFTFLARKDKTNINYKDLSLFLGFNNRIGTFYVDNFSVAPM